MHMVMVSHHFAQAEDGCPVGGVQTHILKVTEALRARGHTVVWRYPAQVYTRGGTWCGPTEGIVVFHDYQSVIQHPGRPFILVLHGHEGIDPIPDTIIQRKREVASWASAVLSVGIFIPRLYGTPCDEITYGAFAPFVDPGKGRDYTPYCLYLGRFERDNTPLETLAEMCHVWDDMMYPKSPRFLVAGAGSLKDSALQMLHARGAIVRDVTGPQARDYIPLAIAVAWTGYLNALDTTAAGRPLLGHEPAVGSVRAAYVEGFGQYPDSTGPPTQAWARAQTWDRLADQYERMARRVHDECLQK